MIKLSTSQIQKIRKKQIGNFTRRAVTYARKKLDTLGGEDDESLSKRLEAVKARANAVNIHAERSIVDLYIVSLKHGPEVMERSETAKFLSDPKANEFVRVRRFLSEFRDA